MRKVIKIVLPFVLIVSAGYWFIYRSSLQQKSIDTYYLYNLQSGEMQSFSDSPTINVKWSPEGTGFILEKDSSNPSEKYGLEVYSVNPLKKQELPKAYTERKYRNVSYSWSLKGQVLLHLGDKPFIYDPELLKIREAKPDESDEFSADYPQSQLSDEEYGKYMELLGESEGNLNYNRQRDELYYTSKEGETYLCDTKSGERKLLFRGVGDEWSCRTDYVKYCVPKQGFDNFNMLNRYPSVDLQTFIYDLGSRKTRLVLDFYTGIGVYSPDDNYVILEKRDYFGTVTK